MPLLVHLFCTALDNKVVCATDSLTKVIEVVSAPDEGDLEATESNSDFRQLGQSWAALSPSSVSGMESSVTIKRSKKLSASGKSPRTRKKLAFRNRKIKLTIPLTSSRSAQATSSLQSRSFSVGQPQVSRH